MTRERTTAAANWWDYGKTERFRTYSILFGFRVKKKKITRKHLKPGKRVDAWIFNIAIVVVRLLIRRRGLVFGRRHVRRGSRIVFHGNWSAYNVVTTTATGIRSVVLLFLGVLVVVVIDHGYDYRFVAVLFVLQQPVDDAVDLAVRVGAAGLQRHRVRIVVRSVPGALLVRVVTRRCRRHRSRRCSNFSRPSGRVRFFSHRCRRWRRSQNGLVHRTVVGRIFRVWRVIVVVIAVTANRKLLSVFTVILPELGIRSSGTLRSLRSWRLSILGIII